MTSIEQLIDKGEYLEALEKIRDMPEKERQKILGVLGDNGLWSLFVNAIVETGSIEKPLEIIKDISSSKAEDYKERLKQVVPTIIRELAENGETDKLGELASELVDLGYPGLGAWARLYSEPTAVVTWNTLREAVRTGEWIKAYNIYRMLNSNGSISLFNTVLQSNGVEPEKFWSSVVLNAFIESMEKGDLGMAGKILRGDGDILPDDLLRKSQLWYYTELAEKLGEEGDTEKIDEILSRASSDIAGKIALAYLLPIIKNPDKYSSKVLEKASEIAGDYGYDKIARTLRTLAELDSIAEKIGDELRDKLSGLGEKIVEKIRSTIETGDPEKIRSYAEKNKELLSSIEVKGTTLYTLLNAIAWMISYRDTLKQIMDKLSRIQREIDKYLEELGRGKKTTIPLSPEEIEDIRRQLEEIPKKYIDALDSTGITKNLKQTIKDMIGYTYLAEAIYYAGRGEYDKAEQLLSKAPKQYQYILPYIRLLREKPSLEELGCILESEGFFNPAQPPGEKISVPTRSGGIPVPVTTAVHPSFRKLPPTIGRGASEYVPM